MNNTFKKLSRLTDFSLDLHGGQLSERKAVFVDNNISFLNVHVQVYLHKSGST